MNLGFGTKAVRRFRRWSRAGYAVFSSLSHCVSIGFLKTSIADSSLRKANIVSAKSNNIVAFDDDSEYDDILWIDNCAVDSLLLQQSAVYVYQTNDYARREGITLLILIALSG